jgi:hypothetical protein
MPSADTWCFSAKRMDELAVSSQKNCNFVGQ